MRLARLVNVLFVCLGNICRSPSAEGMFRHLLDSTGLAGRVGVDSAGTGTWHIGKPPDRRAQSAMRMRGLDISNLKARQAVTGDFSRFDYVLAMDRSNHADLATLCPPGEAHRLGLFLDFTPGLEGRDVPDPYYGSGRDFDRMLDTIELGARGLLDHIRLTRL
jgi:protein-tyrosine phosphatase